MRKRIVDIVMEQLVENGITTCFSVVGGGSMHLNNALALNENINKIFNHHEQACSMAADAYARLSGDLAAVCVTSGPGATNALTGVMGAWQDNLPMIVLSGNVRSDISIEETGLPLRYRGVQEFDIVNSIGNMTKYATVIKNPLSIKKEINKAIKIAMEGRRGPVWLDIPLNIQNTVVEESELLPFNYISDLPKINSEEFKSFLKPLIHAKRPCIIAGSGIVSSHTQEEFENFLDVIQIPLVGGAWVADVFYNEHPFFYGLSGNIGPRTGNFILQNADVILTLGSSLSFNQTGYNVAEFAPNAEILMVDVDENEFLKHKGKVNKFLHTDLISFFNEISKKQIKINSPKDWIEYCEKVKMKFNSYEGAENIEMQDRVCKYHFWKVFNEIAPKNTILALGNSSCNSAKLQVGKRYKNQRIITNYMCGSMGYDLPAAIGVAVASKSSVVCVTGDGSFMMNLQELQTIKQYKLPVKIILFENQGYNAIKQTCKNFFNGLEMGCSPDSGVSFPDFSKIADTFEFEYKCCENNGEVHDKLQWLFDSTGNAFLEIKEILDDPMNPKVMSRIDENGNMLSPAIHDMYPFISENELKELMICEEIK